MTNVNVRVRIDQKAALIAGKVLGEYETVEVSQEVMGGYWGDFVSDLRQENGVWNWGKISLSDTDPGLILGWYVARRAEQVADVEQYERLVLDRDASLASPLVDAECYWSPDQKRLWQFGKASPEYRNFSGKDRAIPCGYLSWSMSALPQDLRERAESAKKRIDEQSEQNRIEYTRANDAILLSLLQGMEAAKAEHEAEEARKQAEADAARKAARLARFAKRLESGYWEKETGSYNERRYGAFWCASVSFGDGPKPIYTWGESTGKWGQAGILRVPCKPGDLIAWGQKDNRNPSKSAHYILRMRKDGGMVEMSKTEAWQHWQEQHAAKA